MRKLHLQVQMSVDGYVAGPNGEMDWMVWQWDDGLKRYVGELTESVDTILLGRKMADGFISHWANVANDLDDPDNPFGKMMTDTPKVVFSKTLGKSEWENTDVASGDLADEIADLKSQTSRDMIVYGGASFVSALIKRRLIDEYHLFVNPAILGKGMTIFQDVSHAQSLKLVNAVRFDCGIALLHYVPNH